ncbi:hypothetical protein LX32DRAFT_94749 [Colletotrichum zoysiae]|uniref:Secreted protein n=1 Tax=Colletotrichum zoysiae TaxID=1216348 RepID=A0AAD9HA54_9PEZI|nr:hypothetical protein LX32DRAFT_94749 [Colletotrichum zoysiae]
MLSSLLLLLEPSTMLTSTRCLTSTNIAMLCTQPSLSLSSPSGFRLLPPPLLSSITLFSKELLRRLLISKTVALEHMEATT